MVGEFDDEGAWLMDCWCLKYEVLCCNDAGMRL